ncbi:MAG TPA: 50S ribosomal protein L5 [candidate division WWE3 bacterium]|uniref:Large ribosomal subunit protein uL5 n=1 Tax=candidate division WWE3 bacterium TaxID=2053526 RepID=A0A7C1DJK0_UNCKA|nr:50S ribosomal protein L5 [candidate division WWE3 bacterium]
MSNRLSEKYKKEIAPSLMKELDIKNVMCVPNISKVTVNAGVGEFRDSKEAMVAFKEELGQILGQTPNPRASRKSISAFKLREGETVGMSATLRGDIMWSFLDKLVNIVLPRVRDFRGVPITAFDSQGNYSLGLADHTIFPEINPNKVKLGRGLQVNVVMTTNDRDKNLLLLEKLGFPFKKEG